MNWCRQRNAKDPEAEGNMYTRWEQDNDLQCQPALGLFEEYLEMGKSFQQSSYQLGTSVVQW